MCGFFKSGYFGGTYHCHYQGEKNQPANNNYSSVLQLLVTANIVPSSLIIFTLMMEAIHCSEMSVITSVTRRHIPEDGIIIVSAVKTSNLTSSLAAPPWERTLTPSSPPLRRRRRYL
jgi:hypothetical protein